MTTECGILDWFLENKKDTWDKTGEIQINLSLINDIVPMLIS